MVYLPRIDPDNEGIYAVRIAVLNPIGMNLILLIAVTSLPSSPSG